MLRQLVVTGFQHATAGVQLLELVTGLEGV